MVSELGWLLLTGLEHAVPLVCMLLSSIPTVFVRMRGGTRAFGCLTLMLHLLAMTRGIPHSCGDALLGESCVEGCESRGRVKRGGACIPPFTWWTRVARRAPSVDLHAGHAVFQPLAAAAACIDTVVSLSLYTINIPAASITFLQRLSCRGEQMVSLSRSADAVYNHCIFPFWEVVIYIYTVCIDIQIRLPYSPPVSCCLNPRRLPFGTTFWALVFNY